MFERSRVHETPEEVAKRVSAQLLDNLTNRPHEFIKAKLEESTRHPATRIRMDADVLAKAREKFGEALGRLPAESESESSRQALESIAEKLSLRTDPEIGSIVRLLATYGIVVRIDDLSLEAVFPDQASFRWSVFCSENAIVVRAAGSSPFDGLSQTAFQPDSPEAEQRMLQSLAFEARAFLWRVAELLRKHLTATVQ
jgi:hypothetical protein